MPVDTAVPTPPRILSNGRPTGNAAVDNERLHLDVAALHRYLSDRHRSDVLESGLVDPSRQFQAVTVDPAALTDPQAATISSAQATANAAYDRMAALVDSGGTVHLPGATIINGTLSTTGLATLNSLGVTNNAHVGGVLTLTTPLAIGDGGTGSATAGGARSNLGLGDIATQDASAVAITGGTIDGTVIGGTTKAAGSFTTLLTTGALTLGVVLSVANGGTNAAAASGTAIDNISGFSGTGLLTRTGSGAYAFRTVTGTSNKVDVTNGDGVSGNPTLTISATYVGQTSITTLGTIATGVWNAGAVTSSGVITATTQLIVLTGLTQTAISVRGITNDLGIEIANSASGGRTFQFLSTNGASGIPSSLRIYDATTGADRIIVNSTGCIAIGAVSPDGTSYLQFPAATSSFAQIKLGVGGPPTSPTDGQIWFETNANTGLKMRINGVTKTVTVS